MQEHFAKIILIEQAVIRGDLEDVRAPARWLAEHEEAAGLPDYAARYLAEMRQQARRAAEATTLESAAAIAGSLVSSCGTCHVAVGRRPAMPPVPEPPVTGGGVGHMLEHQRSVALLEYGLVVPSDNAWNSGADGLRQAPLARSQMPRDPELTNEIIALEAKVHQLGEKARKVRDGTGRGAIYGALIGTCGTCHGLHGRVWGPGIPASSGVGAGNQSPDRGTAATADGYDVR
jgi:cytochrome c553